MILSTLREQFPVLTHLAYLNAGTDGPLPSRARDATIAEIRREAQEGRAQDHFQRRSELSDRLREAYASVLACDPEDVSLTTCTSEGIANVVAGLALGPSDEILTSDEEHPGLLGALSAARELAGVRVRSVPLAEIAGAVDRRTTIVACSHVGWMSGSVAPPELSDVGVPVLLDGAQAVGAVAVDVHALNCDAYAGPGQKWLCGPDGTGMLYTTPALRDRLAVTRRGYASLAEPSAGLDSPLHSDGRKLDAMSLSGETVACALAAFEVLAQAGWSEIHSSSASLAARLCELLGERGRAIAPRSHTTLVSFSSTDPVGERERLAAAGVVLRDIPPRQWLRASVGAWNDEGDLSRLIDALDA